MSTTDPVTAKRRAPTAIQELQRQLAEVETPAGAASKVPPDEALDLYLTPKLEEADERGLPADPVHLALLNRSAGPTLSLVLDRWRGERQPTDKTWREFDRARRLFIEVNGDPPVKAITRDQAICLLAKSSTAGELLRSATLIAFYSGARLSEILGLRPNDWRQEDGVPYFDIQPHEGRGLKTAASRRRVPVHPEILRLGVSRAVLPFNIKPAVFSQRFARWLRGEVGIADPRLVFHSIRHTVRDRLRAARVIESEQRALMGWSSQDVADAYGSGFPLSVLYRAIKKIGY